MSKDGRKKLNVFDFLLIVFAILIAIAVILLFLSKRSGDCAVVCIDNEIVDTIPLDNSGIYRFESSDGGYNIVEVADGKAWVSEADCKGQDCVRFGKIEHNNESIICLPHRFTVTIHSDGFLFQSEE